MTEQQAIAASTAFAAERLGIHTAPAFVRRIPQSTGLLWITIYSVPGGDRVVAVEDSTGKAFEKSMPNLGFPG